MGGVEFSGVLVDCCPCRYRLIDLVEFGDNPGPSLFRFDPSEPFDVEGSHTLQGPVGVGFGVASQRCEVTLEDADYLHHPGESFRFVGVREPQVIERHDCLPDEGDGLLGSDLFGEVLFGGLRRGWLVPFEGAPRVLAVTFEFNELLADAGQSWVLLDPSYSGSLAFILPGSEALLRQARQTLGSLADWDLAALLAL